MLLTAVEARVLGSLMEKETTTPEAYPLSLNALVAACNQKSSREPVLQLTEREVQGAVRSLEDKELVSMDHGSRVERYGNRARTVLDLRRDEAALLCVLLLRGPQTPGELRGRADRLFAFAEVTEVLATLQRMAATVSPEAARRRGALVCALPRQPGAREQRYVHLLYGVETVQPDEADRTGAAAGSEILERNAGMPEHASSEMEVLRRSVVQLEQRVTALELALQSAGIEPA